MGLPEMGLAHISDTDAKNCMHRNIPEVFLKRPDQRPGESTETKIGGPDLDSPGNWMLSDLGSKAQPTLDRRSTWIED